MTIALAFLGGLVLLFVAYFTALGWAIDAADAALDRDEVSL